MPLLDTNSSSRIASLIHASVAAGILGYLVYRRLSRQTSAVISKIVIYPVKGCRGKELDECALTEIGLEGDREYALLLPEADSETGMYRAVSQKLCPKLATLVASRGSEGSLHMTSPSGHTLTHYPTDSGLEYIVDFWGDQILVVDQGDASSGWFSETLGLTCRLCRIKPGMFRRSPEGVTRPNSIHYKSPLLLMSDESIRFLSRRLGKEISYNRFRPNIMISGGGAFCEDKCAGFHVAGISLHGYELCDRCSYTGIDHTTGEFDAAIVGKLRELRNYESIQSTIHPQYKKEWGDRDFFVGINIFPELNATTTIKIGQTVEFIA
jgi:uncharacterized protein